MHARVMMSNFIQFYKSDDIFPKELPEYFVEEVNKAGIYVSWDRPVSQVITVQGGRFP